MDCLDIEGLIIADTNGEILFKKTFVKDEDLSKRIVEKVIYAKENMSMAFDRIVMSKKIDELVLIIYCPIECNEPFVWHAFNEFMIGFMSIIKSSIKDKLWKKYDQVILLVAGFVYEGMIVQSKSTEMIDRLAKRNFEGVDGMKVPKGLASFIHKATKSFTMGSNK
ncbi:subunit zeta of vesicle coat complex COPI [Ordospora colligata]|uniref:Subunit zeta of vesicle coat complex COPI n=1 Tax=Ordospora colligata OC4 TaxID=1354746 RepID=A0A0B2UDK1_9MICR|nr:subunit zeta of vesicle coat complex COPI [Ordospora colligata OC4]KHN69141.1 subunit zeta of vesicle coat complex COPI [Ordospora colligata OC4]TBU14596.1 subunit zeta of vesicle coat complex COPI [Ordospora colligata]TBU14790.1 subunit zeta of vesicle coat complex COPI [Ordospora colligata]TBU18224.1 subunit zeta of vesicle coat complex COPI [Ordospora colligata]